MYNKIMKAIKQPKKIIPYIALRIKKLQVKSVVKDGELYYKYKGKLYPDYLNHGNACQFIADKALTYCKGNGIDIGASEWPLPGAIAIENNPNMNAYNLNSIADKSLDYVFSSHCLEHLDRWQQALLLWISKLKPGGILFIYLPHESMELWNPGGPWVGDNHVWKPKYEILLPFLSEHGVEVIEYNSERDKHYSFHIVCKRIST